MIFETDTTNAEVLWMYLIWFALILGLVVVMMMKNRQ
jgi:uncharacterized protein HemX